MAQQQTYCYVHFPYFAARLLSAVWFFDHPFVAKAPRAKRDTRHRVSWAFTHGDQESLA